MATRVLSISVAIAVACVVLTPVDDSHWGAYPRQTVFDIMTVTRELAVSLITVPAVYSSPHTVLSCTALVATHDVATNDTHTCRIGIVDTHTLATRVFATVDIRTDGHMQCEGLRLHSPHVASVPDMHPSPATTGLVCAGHLLLSGGSAGLVMDTGDVCTHGWCLGSDVDQTAMAIAGWHGDGWEKLSKDLDRIYEWEPYSTSTRWELMYNRSVEAVRAVVLGIVASSKRYDDEYDAVMVATRALFDRLALDIAESDAWLADASQHNTTQARTAQELVALYETDELHEAVTVLYEALAVARYPSVCIIDSDTPVSHTLFDAARAVTSLYSYGHDEPSMRAEVNAYVHAVKHTVRQAGLVASAIETASRSVQSIRDKVDEAAVVFDAISNATVSDPTYSATYRQDLMDILSGHWAQVAPLPIGVVAAHTPRVSMPTNTSLSARTLLLSGNDLMTDIVHLVHTYRTAESISVPPVDITVDIDKQAARIALAEANPLVHVTSVLVIQDALDHAHSFASRLDNLTEAVTSFATHLSNIAVVDTRAATDAPVLTQLMASASRVNGVIQAGTDIDASVVASGILGGKVSALFNEWTSAAHITAAETAFMHAVAQAARLAEVHPIVEIRIDAKSIQADAGRATVSVPTGTVSVGGKLTVPPSATLTAQSIKTGAWVVRHATDVVDVYMTTTAPGGMMTLGGVGAQNMQIDVAGRCVIDTLTPGPGGMVQAEYCPSAEVTNTTTAVNGTGSVLLAVGLSHPTASGEETVLSAVSLTPGPCTLDTDVWDLSSPTHPVCNTGWYGPECTLRSAGEGAHPPCPIGWEWDDTKKWCGAMVDDGGRIFGTDQYIAAVPEQTSIGEMAELMLCDSTSTEGADQATVMQTCRCKNGYLPVPGELQRCYRACPAGAKPTSDYRSCVCDDRLLSFDDVRWVCVDCPAGAESGTGAPCTQMDGGNTCYVHGADESRQLLKNTPLVKCYAPGAVCTDTSRIMTPKTFRNGRYQCQGGQSETGPCCVWGVETASTLSGAICTRIPGEGRYAWNCEPCVENGDVNLHTKGCCAAGNEYVEQLETCCPRGQYASTAGVCCPAGQHATSGQCCPVGETYQQMPTKDGVAGRCCPGGTHIVPYTSPPGSLGCCADPQATFYKKQNMCCGPNTYPVGGVCCKRSQIASDANGVWKHCCDEKRSIAVRGAGDSKASACCGLLERRSSATNAYASPGNFPCRFLSLVAIDANTCQAGITCDCRNGESATRTAVYTSDGYCAVGTTHCSASVIRARPWTSGMFSQNKHCAGDEWVWDPSVITTSPLVDVNVAREPSVYPSANT